MASIWIKNTKGEPSASLTMVVVAFVVVTLWLVVWLIVAPLGVPMPAFEVTTAMGYLMPLLTLYFGRRWTSDGTKVSGEGVGESQGTGASTGTSSETAKK